jgi:DNA-binding transcriptional LysR family regulator
MRTEAGAPLRYTSTDARDVMCMAELGQGKAILPICLAETSERLTRVDAGNPIGLERKMYLHAHPDTVETRRVRTLIGALREGFAPLFTREAVATNQGAAGS